MPSRFGNRLRPSKLQLELPLVVQNLSHRDLRVALGSDIVTNEFGLVDTEKSGQLRRQSVDQFGASPDIHATTASAAAKMHHPFARVIQDERIH